MKSFQESLNVVNGGLGQNRPSPRPPSPISNGNVEQPHSQIARPDQDFEFDLNVQGPPLIPAGIYDVVFLRVEKKWLWGREKLFLWFQIMDLGEYQGQELYMACNAPKKTTKGKVPASNKYYQAWVLAAGRRPDRYDRMSTKVFREKVFLAKVRVVNKNAKNTTRSPLLTYSIIDDLFDRLNGTTKE